MRRCLLAALIAAGTMLMGAAPADAGGPTSVLLTNPGEGRATALYASDPRYAELEALLHGSGSVGTETGEPPGAERATYLNITWLAHDVSVWRTDQLRLDQSGRAWLATWSGLGAATSSAGPSWVRLDGTDALRTLMTSLDLLGTGRTASDAGDSATTAADAGSARLAQAPAPVVREEARWFSLSGWRWAVPGLLLGLVAASLAPGRRSGGARPRQELVDRPSERVTMPG